MDIYSLMHLFIIFKNAYYSKLLTDTFIGMLQDHL